MNGLKIGSTLELNRELRSNGSLEIQAQLETGK